MFLCPSLQLLSEANARCRVTGFGLSTTNKSVQKMKNAIDYHFFHLHSMFCGFGDALACGEWTKSNTLIVGSTATYTLNTSVCIVVMTIPLKLKPVVRLRQSFSRFVQRQKRSELYLLLFAVLYSKLHT